ncbi:MAG TPA: lysylphosphatidylglycerol synthase domain-containing protein [Acidobacteriota bacterium]|nr:lysylphosphatidylglycerol synthase domain-containing protein [Acidobacteriota bacterium]
MKYLEWSLFAVGAALLIFLIYTTGIDTLYSDIVLIGWGFLFVLGQELIAQTANTLGWRFAISPEKRTIPFRRLLLFRIAGDGINNFTPTATIGGEFVRARLIQPYVGGKEGASSVTIAKFAEACGLTVFIAVGFLLVLPFIDELGSFRWIMLGIVLGFVIILAVLLMLFKKGFFRITSSTVSSIGIAKKWIAGYAEHIENIDATISRCTGKRRKDLVLAGICFTVGYCCTLIEIWAILYFLELPTNWYLIIGIEALAVLIDAVTFLVPFKIGTQEGGKMLIFKIFSLDPAKGLAMGVIQRGREVFWSSIGLAIYASLMTSAEKKPAAPNIVE